MEDIKFKCTMCGACCRKAGELGIMPQREDGACLYLAEDNRCKIYDTRPDICNVKKMWEKRKDKIKITEKEYYKFSNNYCNQFMQEYGVDASYRIDLNSYGM